VEGFDHTEELPPQSAECCVRFPSLKFLYEPSCTFFRFSCPGCRLLLLSLEFLSQLRYAFFRFRCPRSISESLDSSSEHRFVALAAAALCRPLLWTNALFVSRNSRLANHRRTAQFFDSAGGFRGAFGRAMVYGGIFFAFYAHSIKPLPTKSVRQCYEHWSFQREVSTGNAQTDVFTVGEMAAHFHRMYRVFDAHHRADLSISDDRHSKRRCHWSFQREAFHRKRTNRCNH
jgi:hypothetical protein